MPVSGAQVLRAKLRMADLLTLPAAVIASVCCVCVTELSPLILLDSVLFARFANALGLREGIVHAKLDCVNEAQAVKQSWAVMLTMLVCWGVLYPRRHFCWASARCCSFWTRSFFAGCKPLGQNGFRVLVDWKL